MKNVWILLSNLCLLFACSTSTEKSGADAGNDTGTTIDATGDLVVAPDTLPEDDVQSQADGEGFDATTEEVVGPQSPYSDTLLTKLCETYCDTGNECEDISYGESCLGDCLTLTKTDDSFLKQLACARNGVEDGDFCTALTQCPGDYEMNADCVAMCDDVAACDALGTTFFGDTLADCALNCTASIGLFPEGQAILDCIAAPLANCSGTGFVACIDDLNQDICEVEFCGEEVEPFCALVPDTYETNQACADACADWSVGQALSAQTCLGLGSELPVDCSEVFSNCFAVPEAPIAGALEYCQLVSDKCGGLTDDQLLADLGGLAHDFCAWQVSGITNIKPGGFQPMADAITCLEAMDTCPAGDLAGLYCLFDITQEHVATCAPITELCTDPVQAAEVLLDCEGTLGFASTFVPEAVDQIAACVGGASSCEDLSTCFFGEEGE